MKRTLGDAAGWVVLALVRLRLALSEPAARRLERALAAVWFHVLRARRRTAEENLALAFGPALSPAARTALARETFGHWVAMFSKMMTLLREDREAFLRGATVEGEGHLRQALAAGRGVVVVSGHVGMFPALGAVLPSRGARFSFLFRKPKSVPVRRLFDEILERSGCGIIDDEPRPLAGFRCLRALKRGECVGILVDQHFRGGAFVPFFGRPARTGLGAALLAARSGAALLPMALFRDPGGTMRLAIGAPELPPADASEASLVECTARLTRRVEAWVRAEPAQWFWMHRRWKDPTR